MDPWAKEVAEVVVGVIFVMTILLRYFVTKQRCTDCHAALQAQLLRKASVEDLQKVMLPVYVTLGSIARNLNWSIRVQVKRAGVEIEPPDEIELPQMPDLSEVTGTGTPIPQR